MRSRNRINRGRQRGSSIVTLPTPPPLSLTAEIEQSVEARDNLEAAIARFNRQYEQATPAFLRSLAADLQATEIAPQLVRERLAVWKVEDTRAVEQLDALQQFLTLFKDRAEGFKKSSRAESASALQKVITRLTNDRAKPGADQRAIDARIAKLSDELNPLQTPPESAAGETAAPPLQKTKEGAAPPPRNARGRAGQSKAAKK